MRYHPQVTRKLLRVHALGPRAVAHLLSEMADELDGLAVLERLLDRYDRLTPELLRATGGDRFPPRPLHILAAEAGR